MIERQETLPLRDEGSWKFSGRGLNLDPALWLRDAELVEDPDDDPVNDLDRITRTVVTVDCEAMRRVTSQGSG